ncbi:MAG: LamG domain-containing protein, partial [Planctomycetota bacterium]
MFHKVKWFVTVLLVLGVCTDAVLGELIAYWSFEEGQGTATADVTGNGNDGTLSGGVEWMPGYKGGAVHFDDAGDRIVVGPIDPTAENNAMTLAAWINWEGLGHSRSQQGIIGKRLGWDPGTGIKWFWQAQPSGALLFRADWANGGGTGLWWNNTYLEPYANEWTHVALTWDDGAAIQYINGEEVSTGNVTFQDTADDTPVTIGCVDSTNNEHFVGIIDEARIYDRALTPAEIQTAMLGEVTTANRPTPPDGAFHEDTWVNLSWHPGDFTVSHDVYFGENLDDVNNATSGSDVFRGNQPATFYVAGFPGFAYPEGLVPGTTYYWRIDEVNDANPDSPWKGDVWSFTIPPKIAYAPGPADGAEAVALDAKLGWAPGFGAKLHNVYFGEDFDTVSSATGGAPVGNATYDPGPLKAAKTYYWRVDEFDPPATHKGNVWSFTTEGTAINPNPAKGAVGVESTPTLSWSPGNLAASHDVYFGEDAEVVKNATKASPEYQGTRALGDESYDTG